MRRLLSRSLILLALLLPAVAQAQLYISNPANFGAGLASVSDCDDCFFNVPIAFPGAGQSLNFFGTTNADLFVGSNGYVTFGAGATSFSSQPLNTQTVGRMIAGMFTDLDSRSDVASQVFVNTATTGQIVVTWVDMGHFPQNYAVRSTFQLVIRSDQFAVPPGEGRIGFFYGSVTDPATSSAGFGDGLAAINPGEVSFFSGAGTGLSGNAPRWFDISGGVPVISTPPAIIPTGSPTGLALLALMLAAFGAWFARSRLQG
jgi:hypothetical protein